MVRQGRQDTIEVSGMSDFECHADGIVQCDTPRINWESGMAHFVTDVLYVQLINGLFIAAGMISVYATKVDISQRLSAAQLAAQRTAPPPALVH